MLAKAQTAIFTIGAVVYFLAERKHSVFESKTVKVTLHVLIWSFAIAVLLVEPFSKLHEEKRKVILADQRVVTAENLVSDLNGIKLIPFMDGTPLIKARCLG